MGLILAEHLLCGGPFLPVHWGTFNLAMHAWDEPPETLLELGAKAGVQLVMPHLGEPIEQRMRNGLNRGGAMSTWLGRQPEPDARREITVPKAMPWPIDQRETHTSLTWGTPRIRKKYTPAPDNNAPINSGQGIAVDAAKDMRERCSSTKKARRIT